MVELVQHELRLHADPGRVVVRPFHLAWQASGPDIDRVRKLVDDIIALDPRTVRGELSIVLNDFADRHWQIERVFDDRYMPDRSGACNLMAARSGGRPSG